MCKCHSLSILTEKCKDSNWISSKPLGYWKRGFLVNLFGISQSEAYTQRSLCILHGNLLHTVFNHVALNVCDLFLLSDGCALAIFSANLQSLSFYLSKNENKMSDSLHSN